MQNHQNKQKVPFEQLVAKRTCLAQHLSQYFHSTEAKCLTSSLPLQLLAKKDLYDWLKSRFSIVWWGIPRVPLYKFLRCPMKDLNTKAGVNKSGPFSSTLFSKWSNTWLLQVLCLSLYNLGSSGTKLSSKTYVLSIDTG